MLIVRVGSRNTVHSFFVIRYFSMLYSTSGVIENLDSGAFIALRIFRARVKNAILY